MGVLKPEISGLWTSSLVATSSPAAAFVEKLTVLRVTRSTLRVTPCCCCSTPGDALAAVSPAAAAAAAASAAAEKAATASAADVAVAHVAAAAAASRVMVGIEDWGEVALLYCTSRGFACASLADIVAKAAERVSTPVCAHKGTTVSSA
jgi:hypothetical protein